MYNLCRSTKADLSNKFVIKKYCLMNEYVHMHVCVTCHRGYIDNGASFLAVLFTHVF